MLSLKENAPLATPLMFLFVIFAFKIQKMAKPGRVRLDKS